MLAAISLSAAGPASAGSDSDSAQLIGEARELSGRLLTRILAEVTKEMEISGPLRSLVVCKYSAPELTSAISRRNGARITRVSLRPRNPATGMADVWEQRLLLEFETRVARGERGDGLEYGEFVSEPAGRFYRYARAISVSTPCLACHGTETQLSPAVRALLAEEYPKDVARGYTLGQVIGAMSVKMPR
jgi:hypothetical protein